MDSLTALAAGNDQEDERVFGDLMEQVGALVERGDSAAAEAVIEAHPPYADRLRRILPTIQALAAFEEPNVSSTGRPSVDLGDAPDRTLGDFRIAREVGRGGMGVVYEAEQISLGRRVALKVLPYASLLDARQLERFKNEARVAAGLHHTNIVPVYTVGSDRGVYYYAMQFIDGRDLADVVQQLRNKLVVSGQLSVAKRDVIPATNNEQLTADTAPIAVLPTIPEIDSRQRFRTVAEWAATAADALAYAHSLGVLHRDIKPANLMLDNAGTIWISDFGLARIECDAGMTMTGDVVGTLRYMSPELARSDHSVVNARTDIYALGATLYELLTLQPAFNSADRRQLLRQINDQEPVAPRRIVPSIPSDLETVVLKAMSKDAASRYARAQDMADDLRRFLEHKPIQARRPTPLERAGKWARRHVALVTIAGAALAVATISFVFATLLTLRAYTSEARQREAAVANLRVASDSIDRMLARVADDQYFHGDLAHAETLAADATEFYEKLLTHSDDPELGFKAAEAHEKVAGIWILVGQHEKARGASLRSIELLRPLIAANSAEDRFLNARGAAYLALGQAQCGLHKSFDAEEPFQQAAADYQLLIDRSPLVPKYQGSLANTLNDLGMLCWIKGQADEAEQCFKRAVDIMKRLPEEFANTPEVWTARAGMLSNSAMLARDRRDIEHAMELLDEAIALQKRSLDAWPENPVAVDFLFAHYWHLSETSIRAGQHRAAAKAVEALVWAFPDRLQAYHYGAEQLLKCAELAEKDASTVEQSSDANPAKQIESSWESKSKSPAGDYLERARELVARAVDASDRTPDTTERYAWFLLTCQDQSLRDPSRALELVTTVLNDIPERGAAWLTLALAHYRMGNWQAADEAVQKSIQYPRGGGSTVCEWLVLLMIRQQQGRIEEARQWHTKAREWCAKNTTDFEYVHRLAAEADALIANF